jgi:anti-anti-sigma factor
VSIELRGEIDASNVGSLESTLRDLWASGWPHITVDLADVALRDSTALAVLAEARRCAQDLGCGFLVINAPDPPTLAAVHLADVLVMARPTSD